MDYGFSHNLLFSVNSHLQPRGTPLLKWQQEPTLPAGLAGAQWNPSGPPRRPLPLLSRKSPPLTNHCRYRRHSTSNWTLRSWKRPSPNWDMTRMEKYLPHFWSDRKPIRQYQVNIYWIKFIYTKYYKELVFALAYGTDFVWILTQNWHFSQFYVPAMYRSSILSLFCPCIYGKKHPQK